MCRLVAFYYAFRAQQKAENCFLRAFLCIRANFYTLNFINCGICAALFTLCAKRGHAQSPKIIGRKYDA